MNKKMRFILNGSMLACTSLLLRLTGLGFSAYVTQHLGAEGTGLLSLVNTVYGFGITVAISGIFLACMRLCSSALAKNDRFALFTAMQKSFLHAAFFGFLAMVLLRVFSVHMGEHFLGDSRTVESIRILSIALPFISLTTVTDSYFTSVGRVYKSAISDITEQTVKIIASILLLKTSESFGLQAGITAITKGSCIGEIAAFAVSFLLYKQDIRIYRSQPTTAHSDHDSLLRISLPIAVSTYARSGLVTLEHALIPKGLQQYGSNKSNALADYGIVRGMALPIVLFPASVLSAFTGLLIPEFTEDNTTNKQSAINRKASLAMNLACVFSVITASVIGVFGTDLGIAVYKNEKAGYFIRCFTALIPFMYCDTTADAMLKGLDKQLYTMTVNIIDAALSVLMTWKVIPRFGLQGYIFTVFMTEILNFSCSAGKLASFVKLSFKPIPSVVFPALCASICAYACRGILLKFAVESAVLRCIIGIGSSLLLILPLTAQFSYPDEVQRLIAKLNKSKKQRNPIRDPAEKSADLIR